MPKSNSQQTIVVQENVILDISPETEIIEYSPNSIDEYIVVVNDPNDWEEIHNYIINENEIDGIPNRKIECVNDQVFSLRTSIYLMSANEVEILKNHPKIESVELNPEKYPQPQSLCTLRYKGSVGFNKPRLVANLDNPQIKSNNNARSNWSHLFVDSSSPSGLPFVGPGVSTSYAESDVIYSLSGKNVDAVIIDSGVAFLHPEFKYGNNYRVRDVILDGPFKVDPDYFTSRGLTYNKVVDGVNIGVGIATVSAREWWSNSTKRSSQFQSLGTASINSNYTLAHVATKSSNSANNQLVDGHGTACASQIGGKTFGLAFDCNLWNIRIALGGVGGYIDPSVALNVCTIFHNAKKISQNGNPDPTLVNNSYGFTSSTGNASGTSYTHNYRGSTLTYTGSGNDATVPSNAGACRNHKFFTYNTGSTASAAGYSGSGQYTPTTSGSTSDSSAESAIAAGVIVVAAAGNQNQKFSDYSDVDFNNWYNNSSTFINRVGGVQKGFSGTHERKKGTIRVGALDCSVEPQGSRQGSPAYSVRRVCYSNNGPMINVWAPAEQTMAAGYTSYYEDYARNDNISFYDTFFNGTSSACPNACSLIALYLETNRKANQLDVIEWLETYGSIEINLSDPYSNPSGTGYWSESYDASTDYPDNAYDSYNYRGNSSLRGAIKKVIHNPYANNGYPVIRGIKFSGISLTR